ncbi:hypothetical protein ACFJGW_00700 [Burkholderiaceae bacterium UC74_6]
MFLSPKPIAEILKDVNFPGYEFEVGGRVRFWIRAMFLAPSGDGKKLEAHHTRKWYVSHHACKNEVVQTALKCVLTSVEHEVRENFRYRGRPIFGPHFSVDALHRICTPQQLDYRTGRSDDEHALSEAV